MTANRSTRRDADRDARRYSRPPAAGTRPGTRPRVRPRAGVALTAAALGAVLAPLFTAAPAHAIIGGHEATPGEQPFVVSVQAVTWGGEVSHYCGGSLIADDWVLTAAHCADTTDAGSRKVRIGSTEHARGGALLDVAEVVVHPEYLPGPGTPEGRQHDVALLRLAKPVEPALGTPVRLGTGADGLDPVRVFGWGLTDPEGDRPADRLKLLDTGLRATRDCAANAIVDRYPRLSLCFDNPGGQSAAQMDSGGPITIVRDGARYQVSAVRGSGAPSGVPAGEYAWVGVNLGEESVAEWITEVAGVPVKALGPS
ncbi:S1 family peptidase [Streptomyces sp. BI20]|uniref:S1 family peptidase n=1 Tax=Streptomyces sp. BI20 TaxID=3403460 RepID=UPI003C753C86